MKSRRHLHAVACAFGLLASACATDADGGPAPKASQQESATPADQEPEANGVLAEPPADAPPAPTLDEMPWPEDCPPVHKAIFAGGWDVKPPVGFDRALFDEAAMLAIPENRHAGRRPWRGVTTDGDVMLIDPQIKDRPGPAMAYVWCLLTWNEIVGVPETELPAVVHLRHRGRIKIWVEGQLLFDEQPDAEGSWQTKRSTLTLSGADDAILVKCARGSPELGPSANFELRVSTPEGAPHPGQIWQTVRVW